MIGADTGIAPQIENNSLSSISPYDLPAKIWSYIEGNFASFGVDVVDSYPTKKVTGNQISWRIVLRRVGTGPTGRKQARGAMLTNFLKTTTDGLIFAEYTQEHLVDFEFAVFSFSTAEADKIAWMLERLVVITEGLLKKEDPGFTLNFVQQTPDLNLQERHEDDVVARYIRFTSTVPVRELKLETELRFITRTMAVGNLYKNENFTRSSTNSIFYIPVDSNKTVMTIDRVWKLTGGQQLLKYNVDYQICVDSNNTKYIKWNDGRGITPQVGDVFRVDYNLGDLVSSGVQQLS